MEHHVVMLFRPINNAKKTALVKIDRFEYRYSGTYFEMLVLTSVL